MVEVNERTSQMAVTGAAGKKVDPTTHFPDSTFNPGAGLSFIPPLARQGKLLACPAACPPR